LVFVQRAHAAHLHGRPQPKRGDDGAAVVIHFLISRWRAFATRA
jgi:hypothetical protein